MKQIFKVLSQTEAVEIPRDNNTPLTKSIIVLQEAGGQYADTFAATLLGTNATVKYLSGDIVYAALRFTTHDHNGTTYQDILVQDIIRLSERAF